MTIEPKIIDDALDFLKAIQEIDFNCKLLAPDPVSSPILFRGHGDSEYTLTPSAHRDRGRRILREILRFDLPDSIIDTEAEQALCEADALWRFVQEAAHVGLSIPDLTTTLYDELSQFVNDLAKSLSNANPGTSLSSMTTFNRSWLPRSLHRIAGIAQHNGLPTRLLDWTLNATTAAYFAAEDCCSLRESTNKDKHPKYLEVRSIGAGPINSKFSVEGLADYHIQRHAVISVPGSGNANLVAQSGMFTVSSIRLPKHGTNTFTAKPFDQAVGEKDDLGKSVPESLLGCRLLLPASEAHRLLQMLSNLGFSGSRMFPGFAGISRKIMETRWY